MAKARKAKIRKAKQSTQLPLSDMRWRPALETIEQLLPHIGNKDLLAHDLTEAVANKKIRCLRRRTNEHSLGVRNLSDAELTAIASGKVAGGMDQPGGHRESVPASFWTAHCFACSPNGDIRVGFRLPPDQHGPSELSFTWTANWVFYLWQPDCVKVWPALAPQAVAALEAEASEPPSPRRKPGRKPRGNWKLEVATEVGLHYRQGKPPPAAKELAQFCQDELGFQPDISEIQKWLRQLLG